MLKSLNRPIVDIHCNNCMQHLIIKCKMDWWLSMSLIVCDIIVRKLFDLELQIHTIEAEASLLLPVDVVGHTIDVYVCNHLWWAVQSTPAYANGCKLCKYVYREAGGYSLSTHTCAEPSARVRCLWRDRQFAFMVQNIFSFRKSYYLQCRERYLK